MYKTLCFVLFTFCTFSALFSTEPLENAKPNPGKPGLGENHKWQHRANEPNKKLHRKCLYPTVKITDKDGDSGGSGFIVRSTKVGDQWHNIVITAAHLVEACPCEAEDLWVHVPVYENWSTVKEYKKYAFTTIARNEKMDMGIGVFISSEQMPTATMDLDAKLYIGTEVFHVGYAILDDARIDHGEITSPNVNTPLSFKGYIRCNVHTFMGDSGGPLCLKNNYKVVGVASAIRNYRGMLLPNISFYTPISALKTWDAELNNALESVYNESAKMPVIPFARLKTKAYTINEE